MTPAPGSRPTPAGRLPDAPHADEVGALARRGASWSALTVAARQAIGLSTTVVLSRLLAPGDYGLVGMVAILTAFLQAFSDVGLSWAAVRHEGLTREQRSNLFWINTAVGLILWGATALAAPALARFFGRPELARVAAAMGAAFAVNGLAVQPLAMLTRQMRARALFMADLSGLAAGAVAALGLAWSGMGYWALVGQSLAFPAGRLAALVAAGDALPGLPRSGAGTWALVRLGGTFTGYTVVNYVARNLDNLLIGRVWGAEALGYYTRAYFLMSLPTMLGASALSTVMVPALAALNGDRARMGRAYREAVRAVALVGLPAAGWLFVAAPEAVPMLYGPRWAPVVPLLRWLSVASMIQVALAPSGWLYIATGRGPTMLVFGVAASAVQASAFYAGNRYGPQGVAAAYVAANLALAWPTLWVSHGVASIRAGDTLRALRPVATATAAAVAAGMAAGALAWRVSDSWSWILAVKSAAGLAAFAGCGVLPAWPAARLRSVPLWPARGST